MTVQILTGDCREVMATLPENSVDAMVTDPPYGIGFMGHEWDQPGVVGTKNGKITQYGRGHHKQRASASMVAGEYDQSRSGHLKFQDWCESWAREAYRVLKPGGHMFAFGGTRTVHRLTCAIEDAGFEIRDKCLWLTGQGFPKSHNLHGEWEGWGTALKPGHEDIVLARKPLIGTVAANVAAHGTGALNIDGCRIGSEVIRSSGSTGMDARRFAHGTRPQDYGTRTESSEHTGRWPANVCLDEDAAALLDAQSGERMSGGGNKNVRNHDDNYVFGAGLGNGNGKGIGGDTGGASRFFLTVTPDDDAWYVCEDCGIVRHISELTRGCPECGETMVPYAPPVDSGDELRFRYTPKASRAERNAGLDGMPEVVRANGNKWTDQDYRVARGERTPGRESGPRANFHPTVKPIALMRWLCRLITPPGGTVLDPFMGSGTTGIAAVLEGFDFIGIEQDAEYSEIARRRIAHAEKHRENWLKGAKATYGGPRRYGNGKGMGDTVRRCPEHGESFPSGSNVYRCGCPAVRVPDSIVDADETPAIDYGPLFAAVEVS